MTTKEHLHGQRLSLRDITKKMNALTSECLLVVPVNCNARTLSGIEQPHAQDPDEETQGHDRGCGCDRIVFDLHLHLPDALTAHILSSLVSNNRLTEENHRDRRETETINTGEKDHHWERMIKAVSIS